MSSIQNLHIVYVHTDESAELILLFMGQINMLVCTTRASV